MAPQVEHELHRRRRSRNVGLGVVLAALIAIVFGLTVVKVDRRGIAAMQGYDHGATQLPPASAAVPAATSGGAP